MQQGKNENEIEDPGLNIRYVKHSMLTVKSEIGTCTSRYNLIITLTAQYEYIFIFYQ